MDDKTNENLVGCLVGLLLIIPMVALRGWVLSLLWRWLFVPIFGLPALSVWQAIGVSVVVGVFQMRGPKDDDDSILEGVPRSTIYSVLTYAVALASGWIVSWQI